MASWMGKSTLEPAQPGSGAELGNKKFLPPIGQFAYQMLSSLHPNLMTIQILYVIR